ncbi:MAG: heparinase II/III family protein [Pseudomonadota bacterium]
MAPAIDKARHAAAASLRRVRGRMTMPRPLRDLLARWQRLRALPEGLPIERLRYALVSRLPRAASRKNAGALAAPGPGVWPGIPERGRALLAGEIELLGRRLPVSDPFWGLALDNPHLAAEFYGFAWLADLVAAGEPGVALARRLVAQWIAAPESRTRRVLHPAIAGPRLARWLQSADRLLGGGDASFDERFRRRIAEEADGLARMLPGGLPGSTLIGAVKGLALAGLALPDAERWRKQAEALVERELQRQILPDGGHVERSPSRQLQLLRDLADVAIAFLRAGQDVPPTILGAARALTPLLRLLQHGDGGLALFNGSNEETAGLIETVLTAVGETPQAPTQAPQTGFQRAAAGRLLLLVESGRPAAPGYDLGAHAGTFAIEISHGRERIVTGCGAHPGDPRWEEALRATAAHSTLTLADTNSSLLLPGDGLGHRPGYVSCKREEQDGNVWLEMAHDGYGEAFGLVHRRRLYLAGSGEDLRGEDRLEPLAGERAPDPRGGNAAPAPVPFALRFHLHPEVQATLAQNGRAALLRLPSGLGWRLRAEGGAMSLADSVYCGRRGQIRRSQQILVEGRHAGGETSIRWALGREQRRKAKPVS